MVVYGNDNDMTPEMIDSINDFKYNNYEKEHVYIFKNYNNDFSELKILYVDLIIVSPQGVFCICKEPLVKELRKFISKKIIDIDDDYESRLDLNEIINFTNIVELKKLVLNKKILSKKIVMKLVSELQGFSSRKVKSSNEDNDVSSIGTKILIREERINLYDPHQFSVIMENSSNHLRIRGIAGSGKTIVMIHKMAKIHYQHPEYDLCYVFYTISLKEYVEKLFCDFYFKYSGKKEYDNNKVKFYHCWGKKGTTGFYYHICDATENEREALYDIENKKNDFNDVCERLINKINVNKLSIFDCVFIDEAQDFKLPFFKLVLKSLKQNGKLIYAYDELQTLQKDSIAPSKSEIFGEEICIDYHLPICYRTPSKILISAHALGMGIYNKNDLCNIPMDLSIWDAIGYHSDEEVDYGKPVSLYRNKDSIEPVSENLITVESFSTIEQQHSYLYREIYRLIKKENVKPDDILIIDLDALNIVKNFRNLNCNLLNYLNRLAAGRERLFGINLVDKDNPYHFRINNSIPYTTVFRAKGNEAHIVFILNVGVLRELKTINRNYLFTAMTRAKSLVYILGCNEHITYKNELANVEKRNYKLEFNYPTKTELEHMKIIAKNEETYKEDYENILTKAKRLKQNNEDLFLKMLMEQTGVENLDALVKWINEKKEK